MHVINITVSEMTDFINVCEDLKIDSHLTYKQKVPNEKDVVSYSRIKQQGNVVYIVTMLVSDTNLMNELDHEVFQDDAAEFGDVSKDQIIYTESIKVS